MKIFTFLALACFYGTSEAKETITWVTENFEPFFIQEGPMKGAGITDRLTAALIKELPEYEHVTEYMPILRITNSLQNGDHIAVNSYLKSPKDESFAIYSITSTVVPPP